MNTTAGPSRTTRTGLLLAAGLMLGWLVSLIGLLSIDLHRWSWWQLLAALLLRAQLQTALFIVGHDAMHGILWPRRPRWNHRLGALALALYAALPYRACRNNHQLHHRMPASAADPDFPSEPHGSVLGWYRQFMAGYLSGAQMWGLLSSWAGLALMFRCVSSTAAANVLLFCTAALLLSSLQLFVFGTYLPHRRQRAPHRRGAPDSLALPPWLSLLTCFHFGYHREHHDHPGLRWFELPAARQRSLTLRC